MSDVMTMLSDTALTEQYCLVKNPKSNSASHLLFHFTVVRSLLFLTGESVSYTHLTLPTIYSV